jgi:cell division ATPase FtsA
MKKLAFNITTLFSVLKVITMSKPTYIAAIDIGTQKITGAIAKKNKNKTIEILAFDSVPTRTNSVDLGRAKDVQSTMYTIVGICRKLANQCNITPQIVYIHSSWLNKESTYEEWGKMIQAAAQSDEKLKLISTGSLLPAMADLYATPTEQNNDCLFIDMGAGTTSYILRRKGKDDLTGMVLAGGNYISNDLTYKGLTLELAEKLKIRLGSAQVSKLEFPEKRISLNPNGVFDINRSISLKELAQMIEDRVSDTARRAIGHLLKDGSINPHTCTLVLSGGGSKLKNLDQWYEEKTFMTVRKADAAHFLNNDAFSLSLNKPQNHAILCMLMLGTEDCAHEKKGPFHFLKRIKKTKKSINDYLDNGLEKLF